MIVRERACPRFSGAGLAWLHEGQNNSHGMIWYTPEYLVLRTSSTRSAHTRVVHTTHHLSVVGICTTAVVSYSYIRTIFFLRLYTCRWVGRRFFRVVALLELLLLAVIYCRYCCSVYCRYIYCGGVDRLKARGDRDRATPAPTINTCRCRTYMRAFCSSHERRSLFFFKQTKRPFVVAACGYDMRGI